MSGRFDLTPEERRRIREFVRPYFAEFLTVCELTGARPYKEIGLLVDPTALDRENQSLLAEELERRYVVPVIRRIRAGTLVRISDPCSARHCSLTSISTPRAVESMKSTQALSMRITRRL